MCNFFIWLYDINALGLCDVLWSCISSAHDMMLEGMLSELLKANDLLSAAYILHTCIYSLNNLLTSSFAVPGFDATNDSGSNALFSLQQLFLFSFQRKVNLAAQVLHTSYCFNYNSNLAKHQEVQWRNGG